MADNSFEKTLKNVESLLPNKCDNIFSRYKQQLDEIEKYETYMQNILQSLNKEKEILQKIDAEQNLIKRKIIEINNQKEKKQQIANSLQAEINDLKLSCLNLNKQFEILNDDYKHLLELIETYQKKMTTHEQNYDKFQQNCIDSNLELRSFKLIIDDLEIKKLEVKSKLPEKFSNKSNEEIGKEIELLKSKCILLESRNADLRNEIDNSKNIVDKNNCYDFQLELESECISKENQHFIQKRFDLNEELIRKLNIRDKRMDVEKQINELKRLFNNSS